MNTVKDWWLCFCCRVWGLWTFWIVKTCSEEAMFKIWFWGIKNTVKDWWCCLSCFWSWLFWKENGQQGYAVTASQSQTQNISVLSNHSCSKTIIMKPLLQPLPPQTFSFWLRLVSWMTFWFFRHALRMLCLEFGWNLLSLKASRTLSIFNDIAGVDDDYGHS